MSITFQKRQKELKRQEKQWAKAQKRELKKLAKRTVETKGAATTLAPDTEQQLHSEGKQRRLPE
jgi:hypothetical protein